MSWSLGHLEIAHRDRVDRYCLSVGKTLYLATEYEFKCQVVLRWVRFVDEIEQRGDVDASVAICNAMRNPRLYGVLSELTVSREVFDDERAAVLYAAREARNYVAHQAAALGPLFAVSTRKLEEKEIELRRQLIALARGDNMVSQWLYEFEEREPAPRSIVREYPGWLVAWVFAASG